MTNNVHKSFVFESFEIDISGNQLKFFYNLDSQEVFEHVLEVDLSKYSSLSSDVQSRLEIVVFNLGMTELVSYWKAFVAPKIIIKAGFLDEYQVNFWTNLYTKGLGEFFYKNQIDFRGLINIEVSPDAKVFEFPVKSILNGSRVLVPFGGGKDAIVAGEILKKQNTEFTWFSVEAYGWRKKVLEVSGNANLLEVGRDVKKNFGKLKNIQSYNGHIPISSVYAFSAAFVAILAGYKYIAISQESSSSEGNVDYLGERINHQYSKSFEAESAIHAYFKRYFDPELEYFSILRDLNEIQIGQEFSKYPQYFPFFVSCNPGQYDGVWCGKCDKCAFTFTLLSAFLEPPEVIRIWSGKNLFEDSSLLPIFKQLTGIEGVKPFDCVGTAEEVLLALFKSREKYLEQDLALPFILKELESTIDEGNKYTYLFTQINKENLIPKIFK